MVVLMFMQGRYVKPFPSLGWFVLVALIFIAFAYAFVKVYRSEKGYLLPVRVWRIGCGLKLSCETLRIPQPTTMGGTLPGAPMRWLVIRKDGNKAKRIVQVYHDLDLLDVNLALAELNPTCG